MMNFKSRAARAGIEGVSRMCAILYDTQRDGVWKGEAPIEPFVTELFEAGLDEQDLFNEPGVPYSEFFSKVFSKLGVEKPEQREYSLLVHRMGPSEFGKIKQGFTGLYIKTHKESIVRNDAYDSCTGLIIRSSRSGAEVRLGHPDCTFKYGPIEFTFPLQRAWEWTGMRAANPQQTMPGTAGGQPVPAAADPSMRSEIDPEFRDLADLFFSRELDPHEFEKFVGLLFKAQGWRTEVRAQPGKDRGVDGRLYYDLPVKPEPVKYVLQAKRYYSTNKVSASDFRDFLGAIKIDHADGGVLATTGEFTRDVREDYSIEGLNVVLYDGKDLKRMAQEVLDRGYFQYAPSLSFPTDQKKECAFGDLVSLVYSRAKTAQEAIRSDIELRKWPMTVDTDVYNENLDGKKAVGTLCVTLDLLCSNMGNDRLVRRHRRDLREILQIVNGFPTSYQVEDLKKSYHQIDFKVG